MELLALLIPLGLLLAVGIGGGSGDSTDDGENEIPAENDIIFGGDTSETINGEAGDDLIFGARGNDEIAGGEDSRGVSGFDILSGEGGSDTLFGGDDGDILLGGSGNDSLSGGADGDALLGGAGNDSLSGGDGDDDLYGGNGSDALDGGEGNDIVSGIDPQDPLTGDDGVGAVADALEDILTERFGPVDAAATLDRTVRGVLSADGIIGADTLQGGAGDDFLIGDQGDVMTGGAGTDRFGIDVTDTTESRVYIDDFDPVTEQIVLQVDTSGPGYLTVQPGPSGVTLAIDGVVVAELFGVAANDLPADAIVYDEPSGVPGDGRADVAEGDDSPEVFTGSSDNDLTFAGGGNDTLQGGGGFDVGLGQGGDDRIEGGAETDLLGGGAGNDTLYGGRGGDEIRPGAGDDQSYGGFGDDDIAGFTGADTISGDAGNDRLNGVDNDRLRFASIDEDLVSDVFTVFGPDTTADQRDLIFAELDSADDDLAADLMYGGDGNDNIQGDSGDTLHGGGGIDFFRVWRAEGDDPALIADFDPLTELVSIVIEGTETEDPIDFALADGPQGAEIRVAGDIVAILGGVARADLGTGAVSVRGYPG